MEEIIAQRLKNAALGEMAGARMGHWKQIRGTGSQTQARATVKWPGPNQSAKRQGRMETQRSGRREEAESRRSAFEKMDK